MARFFDGFIRQLLPPAFADRISKSLSGSYSGHLPVPLSSALEERLLRAGIAPRHVRRYLEELSEHLADLIADEQSGGRDPEEAETAALTRLGTMHDLAAAMIDQRRLRSWSSRAPWAALGVLPVALLGAAYFVACFILWSGWRMFLPSSDTPFIRIGSPGVQASIAIIYFQIGRALYITAPLLVGWWLAVIAARQRLHSLWPFVGWALISLLGGTATVSASQTAVRDGFGHIRMGFALGHAAHGVPAGLLRASIILALSVLPYLVWRMQRSDSQA